MSGTFGSVPTQIARRDTGLNGDAGARLAKTSRLNLRVAPADDALLRQAAELLGETMYVAATRAWDELVVTWKARAASSCTRHWCARPEVTCATRSGVCAEVAQKCRKVAVFL